MRTDKEDRTDSFSQKELFYHTWTSFFIPKQLEGAAQGLDPYDIQRDHLKFY
jgi:hypothetical protein